MRHLLTLATLIVLTACTGRQSGTCASTSDCPSGRACVDGVCETVCDSDVDCGPNDCNAGRICQVDVCVPGCRRDLPVVTSVDGDGTAAAVTRTDVTGTSAVHRVRTAITILGDHLAGSSVSLQDTAGTLHPLTVVSAIDTEIQATIPLALREGPAALAEGAYLLTITNGLGSTQNTDVWLLQGEIGPPGPMVSGAGLIDQINTDTTGAQIGAGHVDLSGFTTGDVKFTLKTTPDPGWVMLDDGTLGNASSGATTRAHADCEPLFTLLWNNVGDAWAPVYDDAGNKVARGGSAAIDFAANRRIRLVRALGRSLAAAGLGRFEETFTTDTGTNQLTVPANQSVYTGAMVSLTSSGTLPTPLTSTDTYFAIRDSNTALRLATSLGAAHSGTAVDITANGSGTHTLVHLFVDRELGAHAGEETHALTTAEMPAHSHNYTYQPYGGAGYVVGPTTLWQSGSSSTSSAGGNTRHNIMQPTFFMHAMIKL